MGTILKVFIEFITILLLFYVLFFWSQGMWDLSFLTKELTSSVLEGEVQATETPGKS